MSDPFTFDASLIKWSTDYEGGERERKGVYPTPTGPVTALDEDAHAVVDRLRYRFDRRVASLSAHQRLTWMATARAEGVAP
jgi:hypothetical protein